jgi:hypothetical protein
MLRVWIEEMDRAELAPAATPQPEPAPRLTSV